MTRRCERKTEIFLVDRNPEVFSALDGRWKQIENECHENYTLWVRVKYDSYLHNSFWVQLDQYDNVQWRFDDTKTHQWHWERISMGPLSKGPHSLKLKLREEQTKVDKFLITSDGNYKPYGHGDEAENCPVWYP